MPEGRLVLLGSPHAELDGQVVTIAHRKPLALLAYLAVIRCVQSREALASLFWPEQETSRAYAYLRNALWQLGQTPFGPWLIVDRDSVAVADDLWVDVSQLEADLAAARAHSHNPETLCPECVAHLVHALSLYQGDFITGFALNDSPEFEEWQFFQSEHLRQGSAYALETLTRYYGATGDLDAALSAARKWAAQDLLNEPAQRALMTLYAQGGQRTAALHQYDTLLRNLRAARLGPSTETVDLYRRIRGGEIEVETAEVVPKAPQSHEAFRARHNLPVQTTTFVGRDDELAELYDLLGLPECRLVTLTGPGGIGKTRLALQAAQEQVNTFSDGVVFVPLASVTTLESMILAIADALGTAFYPQNSAGPSEQLLAYLDSRKMLLVLDNFEHLLDHAQLLVQIIEHTPATKLIATSRERLNIRGEWVQELHGLTYTEGSSPETTASDATELFIDTAERITATFAPDDIELEAIGRICRLVEGMPLGIELAASWTKMLSCTEIAEEVEASLDFLTVTLRDLPERHQSLRAVFARSWGLLSDGERRTFRALSVFRGGFTREAAQAVAGATLPALSSLIDKSLLQHKPGGRFEILEVLRQYAEEQLYAVAGEAGEVRNRHASYYLSMLQRMESPLKGVPEPGRTPGSQSRPNSVTQLDALDLLHRDVGNIRAGWYWALDSADFGAIQRATMGLGLFCEIRSRYREGERLLRDAVVALSACEQEARPALLGLLLGIQGQYLCRFSNVEEGCATMERARTLLLPESDRFAFALVQVLSAYIGLGLSSEQRQQRLEDSLRTFHELGDTWGAALSYETLGEQFTQLGDYAAAEPLLRESLALRRSTADEWGTAMSLHALGTNDLIQGKGTEAMEHYLESLSLREHLGNLHGVTSLQTLIGDYLAQSGDLAAAEESYRQSIAGYQEIGDPRGGARAYAAMGSVAYRRGDLEGARTALHSAVERLRPMGSSRELSQALRTLAEIAMDLHEGPRAHAYLDESLAVLEQLGDHEGIANLQHDLARLRTLTAPGDEMVSLP